MENVFKFSEGFFKKLEGWERSQSGSFDLDQVEELRRFYNEELRDNFKANCADCFARALNRIIDKIYENTRATEGSGDQP
jgi:hypothetical protein